MTACCARCAASFGCGARAGRCWCQDLPSLAAPDPANGCYCPACLEAMLAAAGASDKVPGDAMPTGPPGRRRGTAK